MDCQWIKTGIDTDGIARITLCRPSRRNALDDKMIVAIKQTLMNWQHDNNIRALIIDAEGSVFCAGADIEWMHRAACYSVEENIQDASELGEVLRLLYYLPFPTIVLAQGPAYGGALGLVAACDIALCTPRSTFCLSEVRLGLVPAMISPYLIRAIGERNTLMYTLSAKVITPDSAYSMGLVHDVVEESVLRQKGKEISDMIGKGSPGAQREAKSFLRKVKGRFINESLVKYTAESIARMRTSVDGQEGMRAFLEKRKPDWSL